MSQDQSRKVLPLPDSYSKDYKDYQLLFNIFFLMSILDFSFLIESSTNLKIVRQSLIIIIPSIPFLLYYYHQIQILHTADIIMHPRVLFFFSLTIAAFIRVPFYSLVGAGSSIWFIWKELNKEKNYFKIEHTQGLFQAIILLFSGLCMLVDEEIISLTWKSVFVIPGTIAIIAFSYFILRQGEDYLIIKQNHVVSRATHSYHCNIFFMSVFLVNFIVMFSKNYIESEIFLHVMTWSTIIMSLVTILMFIFLPEITVYSIDSKFQSSQTQFRVQKRRFSCKYRFTNNDNWSSQQCLFCSQEASVIHLPCGHLTLCEFCTRKLLSKRFRLRCMMCGKSTFSLRLLQLKESKIKHGFQMKFFIEKKLQKNQFLASNIGPLLDQ